MTLLVSDHKGAKYNYKRLGPYVIYQLLEVTFLLPTKSLPYKPELKI